MKSSVASRRRRRVAPLGDPGGRAQAAIGMNHLMSLSRTRSSDALPVDRGCSMPSATSEDDEDAGVDSEFSNPQTGIPKSPQKSPHKGANYRRSVTQINPFSNNSSSEGYQAITGFMACVMVSLMVMILYLLQKISWTLTAVAPPSGTSVAPAVTGGFVASPGNMIRTTGIHQMAEIVQRNLRKPGTNSVSIQVAPVVSGMQVPKFTQVIQPSKPIIFDKPYSSLTYDDIPFQATAMNAPSCSVELDVADISFTLVTQVSEDRLWMLTQHCKRWPGVISVAVFTDKSVKELEDQLDSEGQLYGKCRPNQVAFSVLSKKNFENMGYPVNALRNLAFRNVYTTHFMYADIDFWVSSNLHDILNLEFVRRELANDAKLALIIPAFQIRRKCSDLDWTTFNPETEPEPECRDENIPRMPLNMEDLTELLVNHQASAFDPTNRGGHGSTSYREWFRMSDGELWDIPCILSNRYEPYVAARWCDAYPPYQEVFTGYGKNKMTQIMQMRHEGYIFSQVGGVFVCHYPHPVAQSREIWNSGRDERKLYAENRTAFVETFGKDYDWTQFKRGQVDKLFVEYKRWLRAKVPNQERTPMCQDQFNDDLKLWLSESDRHVQIDVWANQNLDSSAVEKSEKLADVDDANKPESK